LIQFCDRVAESISAYVDGESSESAHDCGLDRASIEAHLKVCTYCGALRHRMDKTQNALRGGAEPPKRLWDGIESALRAEGLIRTD
jgi:anti-sigma factor RsiW